MHWLALTTKENKPLFDNLPPRQESVQSKKTLRKQATVIAGISGDKTDQGFDARSSDLLVSIT